ncbi:DNA polymerase III subunit gamma/tau [Paraburkholderia madseniana]|uniref:DNA-directed DNA polymerase n=1 Tax=Paraburkholderia madseniana TaxID=2599607 RepID=A0AAP5BAQ6_9BURK|nr:MULTISPECIES: DNA polymerase III subunit gamma/tau [Paraburkholderia]MCX4146051.1 DNA polymerase III subunit gamma/tau [Paraburkholderia madseniana]MDN7148998.1 DNA polymerase III subunit gamma/tau [Paraburkholderia sp. WS6]MDQ6407878.1 DNA polymerase III subunit gamma/tau [Paraburkholderia madseniana]
MTYQVLARKWRPKDFASLVGQEHVVRALTHALDGGRLHHAYLFTGTRGVGKTTLSRIFAKALNCETGVTSTPCGVCRACREIDEGRFVDYVEMDAASNRGVDEMAALLERAVYAPVDARFKVYMIDEVHMLTNHAFNAMLKTLEEPPSHVKFILATTDPQKIPVTVLSRCLQFNLKQMPAGHIVSHLEHILGEEKVPFDAQALRLLARAADGSMRDALSLTDQAIAYSANQVNEEAVRGMLGALDQSYLIRLLDALADGDGAAVLSVADEMALRSLSFSTALQDLASLLHRIAWAQFAPSSVLDEWPEAGDLRRFAEALSAEQVQLFYQIATIGRSELGLAPDEYAGFTMTLLRMLAFEPAPTGGGGGAAAARAAGPAGAGGAKRAGSPAVAAQQAVASSRAVEAAAAVPVRSANHVVEAKTTIPDSQHVASSEPAGNADAPKPAIGEGSIVSKSASASSPASGEASAAPAHTAPDVIAAPALAPWQEEASAKPVLSDPASAPTDTSAPQAAPMPEATSPALATEAAEATKVTTVPAPAPATEANESIAAAKVAAVPASATEASESTAATKIASAPALAPWDDAPTEPAWNEAPTPAAPQESSPASPLAAPAPAASARAEEAAPARASQESPPAADIPPRRAGGASDALNVLRSAGLKVSSDRGRATAAASAAKPAAAPATPKPAAPRVVVNVPTPGAPRRAPQQDAAPAARAPSPQASEQNGSSSAPWDDMPPDEYMPLTAADEGYYGLPDDNYMPVFDSGPDDVRVNATPASTPAPVVDKRPLPPAVSLDPLGFQGDWPALAVDLPLKGISYQLAFNSELMALEGNTLKLNVPVPQYAEASQVAKLKAALAEKLGQNVDVLVEVGPARRTAAAHDAAMRAQRQQEAEREIGADPFVQSLIREFGASIVPGSIRPITQDAGPNGAPSAH